MEDLIADLFAAGGLAFVAIGLACVQFIISMAEIARDKGDDYPFASAFSYLLIGGLGGLALNFIFPIIGLFIGFPLALKLYLGKNISFWAVLFYPITFAILIFVFLVSLGMMIGGLEKENLFVLGFGAFIFFATFYSTIVRPLVE